MSAAVAAPLRRVDDGSRLLGGRHRLRIILDSERGGQRSDITRDSRVPVQVQLRVRLFALARQLAATDSVVLTVTSPATVRDLRRALAATCPAVAGLVPQMLFAVNSDYADDATVVTADSEVACIPPVSGG